MTIDSFSEATAWLKGARLGCVVLLSVAGLAACGKASEGGSQVVASVSGDEITESQVNGVLQKQANLKPDQIDAASHRAVEGLVQQEIVLRKARELKLDRDQQVVQNVEAAKRDIIAKAYLDRIAEGATKPSPKDVQAYYDANPALFAERRVFNFQEVSVEVPDAQKKEVEGQLTTIKSPGDFDAYLKAHQLPYKTSRSTVAAENVPLPMLERVSQLKPGQGLVVSATGGLRILMLLNAQDAPLTVEQATPAIGAFLWNQRRRTVVEQELTALRSGNKVEFFGKYADLGASAPAASAPAAASSPKAQASGPALGAADASLSGAPELALAHSDRK